MRSEEEREGWPAADVRLAIRAGLEERRQEIEARCRECIEAVGNPSEIPDVEYGEGLRASIPKAFEYGLATVSGGSDPTPPVPAVLLAQARLAARNGVDFAIVQRRYMECFYIFTSSLDEEIERQALGSRFRGYLRETTKMLFDVLINAVEDEHEREQTKPSSPESRQTKLVRAHLAGKRVDTAELGYEFNYFHVGLVARGTGAAAAIKDLASELDCLALFTRLDDQATWGWLGKRQEIEVSELLRLARLRWPSDTPLGIGENGQGNEGWRLTHRQAGEAFRLSTRASSRIFRYGDNPLLPSLSRDEDLIAYLRRTYLEPLDRDRHGACHLETLRAYIATNRNGASAAKVLGVERQTVSSRLKAIEQKLGCSISERLCEIEVTLQLDQLRGSELGIEARD